MPTLISQSEIKVEWTDIDSRQVRQKPTQPLKRSSGVHLSGVIKHVATSLKILTPEDRTDEMPIRMCLGMAWEDWVVGLWPEMDWQPGEQRLDGVSGSPDGLSKSLHKEWVIKPQESAYYHCLEEFKCTWKSVFTRQDITEEKMWMWQLAGYCKMMGLNYARLHVFWVNGDYRPPSPRYMTYLLHFSQQELDRFWANVVLKNRDKAVAEEH